MSSVIYYIPVQIGVGRLMVIPNQVGQLVVSFIVDRSPAAIDGGVSCLVNSTSEWGSRNVSVTNAKG